MIRSARQLGKSGFMRKLAESMRAEEAPRPTWRYVKGPYTTNRAEKRRKFRAFSTRLGRLLRQEEQRDRVNQLLRGRRPMPRTPI